MDEPKKIKVEFASRYQDLKLLKRRWFPLWTLDMYVLKEFMIKYSILLLVFCMLFILSDIYRDISDFIDAGASWREIGLYLLLRLPGNIRFILPISMLLGCMWTMATFGKNLEVTAMRASGVSLMRSGGAIFAVGLIVTGVNIYFNELLIPVSSVEAERLFDRAAEKQEYARSLLIYKSNDEQRRWLFQLFIAGENQKNVTLKTYWNSALIDKLLGTPGTRKYEKKLQMVLDERYGEVAKIKDPVKRRERIFQLLEGRKINFMIDEASFDYDRECWTFHSGKFISFSKEEETLYAGSTGTVNLHDEIAFENLIFSKKEIPEQPEDILNAVKEKDNLSTPVIMRILKNNPDMPPRVRCIYETVMYYRIAFPWACFLAVFLGIPLATRNERTGSMLAIISAIVLIVVYIVIAQLFLMLGKSGALPPIVCGLAPTAAFIIAGAAKIMHDRV